MMRYLAQVRLEIATNFVNQRSIHHSDLRCVVCKWSWCLCARAENVYKGSRFLMGEGKGKVGSERERYAPEAWLETESPVLEM